METDDPRVALTDKTIELRTAAARDLARIGTLQDVPTLIECVTADKSPSVRLYAAAAAAEIMARHRGAYDQVALPPATRREILQLLAGVDPARAPSVLLCYASFPETTVLKRLARMIRDLDHGVRAGAGAAFRRMALSGAATREGTGVREWVAEALRHPKTPADAVADLSRLVGEVGWTELRHLVADGLGVEGAVGDAATEAIARLEERDSPEAWNGIWLDEGRDVQQLAEPIDGEWLAVDDARPVNGKLELPGGMARRIWAPRLAEDGPFEALQMNGRTFWRLAGKRLIGFVEEQGSRLMKRQDAVEWLLASLDEQDGAAAQRAAVILLVRTGRFEAGLARLEKPLGTKKPRNDLRFLQALALLGLGRDAEAQTALQTYLDKAKRKEPWRAEAEALLTA